MTRSRPVTAIVLAGGRSSRFGRDKLAEPIGGRPLLELAIDGARAVSDEVIVVTGAAETAALPPGVRVVRDRSPYEGPLAGTLAGLAAASSDLVLVTGGDMPGLVPAVIEAMVETLHDPRVEAVLLDHDGRPRPLPMVLRRRPAEATAAQLIAAGERRLGALPERLTSRVLEAAAWRRLDPDARTMRDIDTPADLV